ncbi:hypothetical protein BTZ20_3036 [Rhodococcus sp. MTM3W5.2]|nr:hypothetical protein BTZ20_3036 [Rhodococcus sp. MTM3W5.2]
MEGESDASSALALVGVVEVVKGRRSVMGSLRVFITRRHPR